MTAPAAPVIKVRQNGTNLYIRWQPVLNATDYNLYVGDTIHPTGLEDSIPEADIEPDGWFIYITEPYAGVVWVRLTALNLLAEESGYSNEMQVNLMGGSASPDQERTEALSHNLR